MRVVYVSTDEGVPTFGTKGSSVHVQAMLSQFLDRGDEVHLVTPRPGSPPPAQLSRVQVHLLPGPEWVDTQDPAGREAAARARDAQVALTLERLHEEAPVDLVYERYALWGRTATAWARAHGVCSVLEVNSPLPDEQARHRVLVDQLAANDVAFAACGQAGIVVCVSEPVADWVRALGSAPPESVHTVPNGVDTRRFSPSAWRRELPTFTLGFVGTLKPWHGVEDLVRAFRILHDDDPSYRLLLVGDGPERGRIEQLIAELALDGAVELTGAVQPMDIPRQLSRMDVAVAPYPRLDDFYFSPLKVYEYLAAGVPVVASDVGSLPALLVPPDDAQLGVLYPAGSAQGLADAVSGLRKDPETRLRLSAEGRRAMVERHDWRHVLDHVLGLAGVGHVPSRLP
jgi:glycosyltransferase involved in cell wall biosynthesis